MICDPLADTGAPQLWLIVVIAFACLITGAVLVIRRYRIGPAASLVLGVLLVGSAMILPIQPALASTPDCSTPDNAVDVIQTSTMQGLGPEIAPVPITGEVTNAGAVSMYITTVDVEIMSITVQQDSVTERCDPTDYVLLDRQMPVNHTLGIGQSTTFAGATIGFSNKPTSQDACQNATVHLHYTAHTSGH